MNNYAIDAGVLAVPDVNNLSLKEKATKYQEFKNNISVLQTILKPYKKDIKLFLFRGDVISLNRKVIPTNQIITEVRQLGQLGEKTYHGFHDLYDYYLDLVRALQKLITKNGNPKTENQKSNDLKFIHQKCTIIESHLDMTVNDIAGENNLETTHDLKTIYNDTGSIELFRKKLMFLAFLNRFIYLNSEINKLVINAEIPGDQIQVSIKIKTVNHHFLLDFIPKTGFTINKQPVEFCKFDEKHLRKHYKTLNTVEDAFLKAKSEFSGTLDFSDNIQNDLKKYQGTMDTLKKDYPKDSKVDNHVNECPNTLFDHLEALDKLVKYYRISQASNNIAINKRKPIMEKFRRIPNDMSTCYNDDILVCKKCSAFLRFCRYNCSGEDEKIEAKKDDKQFIIHLKPYSYSIDGRNNYIADLSLRIYFRWDTDKIQVGYIGKHL